MKNSVRQFITVYVMVFIGTMAGYSQTQYNAIHEET